MNRKMEMWEKHLFDAIFIVFRIFFLPMLPKVGKILNKSELSSLCFGPKHKGEERKESLICRNQLSFPGSDDMVPGGELRVYLQLEF